MKVTVSEEIEQVKSKRFILSVKEEEYAIILALAGLTSSTDIGKKIVKELGVSQTADAATYLKKGFFTFHNELYSTLIRAVAESGEPSHTAFVRAMASITRNAGE